METNVEMKPNQETTIKKDLITPILLKKLNYKCLFCIKTNHTENPLQ